MPTDERSKMFVREGDKRITPCNCYKEGSIVRKQEVEASFGRLKKIGIENVKPQPDPPLLSTTPLPRFEHRCWMI